MIDGYLTAQILKDLDRKMVFVSGPRQAGKTTLAQAILRSHYEPPDSRRRYFSWDDSSDREMIYRGESPFSPGLLVFDELHWKNRCLVSLSLSGEGCAGGSRN